MGYKILNKENKKFFSGFTASGRVKWSAKGKAMDFRSARAQALLLLSHEYPVQQKPVAA